MWSRKETCIKSDIASRIGMETNIEQSIPCENDDAIIIVLGSKKWSE